MDRDPSEFDKRVSDTSSGSDDKARVDAWLSSLPPAPGIRHIDDVDDEQDAQAMADVAAGRCYPHEVVGRWLMTWGEPDQKPFKDWLAEQDG